MTHVHTVAAHHANLGTPDRACECIHCDNELTSSDLAVKVNAVGTGDTPLWLCCDCASKVLAPEDIWGITAGKMTSSGLSYRAMLLCEDSNELRGVMMDNTSTPWYPVAGGFMSPEYLSMMWHGKLATCAKYAPRGTFVVTLMKDGDIVDVVMADWRDRNDKQRFIRKGEGYYKLLDEVEEAASNYRPKRQRVKSKSRSVKGGRK